jgi:phage gpG-like protein
MGTTFLSLTMGNFKSGDYRPQPWPAKSDHTPSNLQKNMVLCRAFHLTVSNTGATVGNPAPYAAIHQFGGTITGKPWLRFKIGDRWVTVHQVTIPARPFFPVEDGKLTPKAEEKIKASGERACQRQFGEK